MSLYRNGEGYPDPTAYTALKSIDKTDKELNNKVRALVKILHEVSHIAGFEIVGKVHLKHKRTGKEYK